MCRDPWLLLHFPQRQSGREANGSHLPPPGAPHAPPLSAPQDSDAVVVSYSHGRLIRVCTTLTMPYEVRASTGHGSAAPRPVHFPRGAVGPRVQGFDSLCRFTLGVCFSPHLLSSRQRCHLSICRITSVCGPHASCTAEPRWAPSSRTP